MSGVPVPAPADASRPRRSARRVLIAALSVVTALAVAGGVGLVGLGAWRLVAPAAPAAAERHTVERRAPALAPVAPAEPSRVTIPALSFDAPVTGLPIGDATVLDPPAADEVFWLSDFGLPGAGTDNTVFLIGHTSADGRAVFDPLINRAERTTMALPGDEVLIDTANGTVAYEIIATERHDKTALATVANVWENVPGRLVIITCLFQADRDVAPDNVVVFAQAVPHSAE